MRANPDSLGDGKAFPPGFRFHPTDEELVLYYLKRKICGKRHLLDVIAETDVYKWDPEELPGMSKLKTGDRQWFFFSHRDRKYPNGARSNRATLHGYWKVTGKDRVISCGSRAAGIKKTLVFYRGRAPNGERTDWVMHEYTVDEDELKRFPAVKEYYVLYKVYKKSGPGPKNGEQYGAPFNEADWADDEHEVHCLIQEVNLMQKTNEFKTSGNVKSKTTDSPTMEPRDDLEEFLKLIADEPIPIQPLDHDLALHQFAVDEETQSAVVDCSFTDMSLPAVEPFCPQLNVPASFNLTNCEAPEATSPPNNKLRDPLDSEEDFLDEFLEMDDLCNPDPATQHLDESVTNLEKLQFHANDGLVQYDLFQDASPFFSEMGLVESGLISQPYMTSFDGRNLKPMPNSHSNNLESITRSYLQQQQFNNFDGFDDQLWIDEQTHSVATATEVDKCNVPSASGVLHQNHGFVGADENRSRKQDDDGTESLSWFSSTLWSFVDSIPTTPASASESILVNRASQQISNLSRIRVNARNTNVTTAASSTSTSSGIYKTPLFISFSLVGVMCAALWMMNGNLHGRLISSM